MVLSPDQACDFELLRRWQEGDKLAGNALYEQHRPLIVAFLRRMRVSDVDDVVQNTFVAFIESRDRFRQEASVRTFLLAIALRQLRVQVRQNARNARSHDSAVHANEVSPLSELGLVERELRLLEVLPTLDAKLQRVVQLKYWQGLTVPQVASLLSVPPGTVASRLRLAHQKLRELLGEDSQ